MYVLTWLVQTFKKYGRIRDATDSPHGEMGYGIEIPNRNNWLNRALLYRGNRG